VGSFSIVPIGTYAASANFHQPCDTTEGHCARHSRRSCTRVYPESMREPEPMEDTMPNQTQQAQTGQQDATVTQMPGTTPQTPPESEVGFFEDDKGNRSCMRLMSITALLAAIVFGMVTLLSPAAADQGTMITFGFLLSAFAPKALQKFAETSVPKS
jgi:hypothetical protein